MADTMMLNSTGTVPAIPRLSMSTIHSRGDENVDSETVVTDGFRQIYEVLTQYLSDGSTSLVHSSHPTGDADDEDRSENNIPDEDESSDEDDKMEVVASYSDDSRDEELWQELLEHIESPYVDDFTTEEVGEEGGEHVVEEAIVDDDVGNCVNEVDEANGCDIDEDDNNDVEEWVRQLRTESEKSDEDENGSDQDVDESNCSEEGMYEGEHDVDESINSDEGDNGGEDDVHSSDNEEESIDEIDEEYESDTHSEYSVYSDFIDFETERAGPQQINALPSSTVSQEQLAQFSEDVCSICFDEFELDQEIKVPPCTHIFHAECLNTWLENDRRCPCCRMSCITDVNQPDRFMITYDNFF